MKKGAIVFTAVLVLAWSAYAKAAVKGETAKPVYHRTFTFE